jgi:hypothetical protein
LENVTLHMPEIKIVPRQYWVQLDLRYRSEVVIVHGNLNLTETFYYLSHIVNRSAMVHSLAEHLTERKASYSKQYSFEYQFIKAALLEGFFGLRESVAGLVNLVFQLGVDSTKLGSTLKVFEQVKERELPVLAYLNQIVPRGSMLDGYLAEFRHPYVHREDLSKGSVQDFAAALAGLEQPRIMDFIDKSASVSQELEEVEKGIAAECGKELGFA